MSDCIFCKIVAGEIPSFRLYEDDICLAMLSIGPATEGHALVIPKEHHDDLCSADEVLAGHLLSVAKKIGIRQKERLGADGFNIVQNNGAAAGQTVSHLHIHVIARKDNDKAIELWNEKQPSMEELAEVARKLSD